MDAVSRRVYQFEGFTLDMMRRILSTPRARSRAQPSEKLRCALLPRGARGPSCDKARILSKVWPGVNVTDKSLARCVSNSLGDRRSSNE